MPDTANNRTYNFLGTNDVDVIIDGYENDQSNRLTEESNQIARVNGREGDDVIRTTWADDLAAGDMVGNEWSYVNGQWVYDASAVIVSDFGQDTSFDDLIQTGNGNDVLLGNGGNDQLFAGNGNDIVNGGTGNDSAFGGHGNDTLNLEDGDDFAEAGFGDDIINAGNGNDVVYGDLKSGNLLEDIAVATSTLSDLANTGTWTMEDSFGEAAISQSVQTVIGESYTISFDLAANLAGGHSTGAVDVMWNGAIIDTVETTSGAYTTFEVDVVSTGSEGQLSFRAAEPSGGELYNFDGPIISYTKDMTIGGETTSVAAFAPGQANLYQVIDGHLNVFDVETNEYISVGDQPGFRINAVGFNIEDDLIYGVAKSSGVDSLGNAVRSTDIVMVDAAGATYRIGDGYYGDYVGDFDDNGNLWTFHSGLNRVSVIDVDQQDETGNPVIEHYKFPIGMFSDRTYDLAYNSEDGNFYAVVSPGNNGQAGKVVKIDFSSVRGGGTPTFTEVSITGTLYGDTMESGMSKGAYGAVFLDGEGNLYFGLNKGDHDLNSTTDAEGAIFKVNVDWDQGRAYAEFMAEAPTTGSNDGAVDPRSLDAFSEIDAEAAVLIQAPVLTLVNGGNDILRGGHGNDELHGNEGSDDLSGGIGDDVLFGDQGNDNISGGTGNDWTAGGTGDDDVSGGAGNDELYGNEGQDYLSGGVGDDHLSGGNGADKIVGGTGSDDINGGAGNDNLWGGDWTGDNTADTFIFESGTGKDYIHDYEVGLDVIDLSSFDTALSHVQDATTDLGWGTVIDLQQLDGGQTGDRVVLQSVVADDLSASDFIF